MPKGIYIRKPLTTEHKNNISKAVKKRHKNGDFEFLKGQIFSAEIREKFRRARLGLRSNAWKGGRTINKRGYIFIYQPNHPYCDKRGYVREHRVIIEKQIGRYLIPEEKCHHINNTKNDNRPENLMAFINHSAHSRYEQGGEFKHSEIIFDGKKL